MLERDIKNLDWKIDPQKIIDLVEPAIKIQGLSIRKAKLEESKFGGTPDLHIGIEWPRIDRKPLAFLGQINFNDIQSHLIPKFFRNKMIAFFISGYKNHYREVGGAVHKIIISDLSSKIDIRSISYPTDLEDVFRFEEKKMTFRDTISIPSYQHWKVMELDLGEEDEEIYDYDLNDLFKDKYHEGNEPSHQLFGYSYALQGDTNTFWAGKYLNCTTYPKSKELQKVEKEFRQLVQFDLGKEFNTISSSGYAYFGYHEGKNRISIECILQNT